MAARFYINTSKEATLLASVGSGDTTFNLSGSGMVNIPALPFTIRIDPDTASEEVCLVTAGSATSLTVTRGFDGTSTFSHTAGAKVRHVVVAEFFNKADAHVEASTNVHGLSGGAAVVGTTQSQTLTNKTLSASVTDVAHSTSPAATQAHRVHADAATARNGFTWDNTGGSTGKAFLARVASVDKTYIDGNGNLVVGGTSGLTGLTNTGLFTNTGNASISGTLAAGATTVTGALSATGAVDFDSTLNVDGNTTLNANVNVGATTQFVWGTPAGAHGVRELMRADTNSIAYNVRDLAGVDNIITYGGGAIETRGRLEVWNMASPVLASVNAVADVTSPIDGDMVFDRTLGRFQLRAAGAWVDPAYPLGIWGGRIFSGTGNIGAAISTTETAPPSWNSTSLTLLANRRYNIKARIKVEASAGNDQFILRIRKSTVTGTILSETHFVTSVGVGHVREVNAEYNTTAAEVGVVFVGTIVRLAGSGTLQPVGAGVDPAQPTGCWVEDAGPSGRLTILAV